MGPLDKGDVRYGTLIQGVITTERTDWCSGFTLRGVPYKKSTVAWLPGRRRGHVKQDEEERGRRRRTRRQEDEEPGAASMFRAT